MLSDVPLKLEYRSDIDNLVDDFFIPCLRESLRYDRAVGYFTSDGLSVAARGIYALVRRGGSVRLVASPRLKEEDVEQIKKGYATREETITRALIRELEWMPDAVIFERVSNLAWLVASGALEVKVALKTDDKGIPARGIYHEKVGIFYDGQENLVAFTGSPNETEGGLVQNFESLDVFTSWTERGRVEQKVSNFARLWGNATRGLDVMTFPEAARKKLLSYKPDTPPQSDAESRGMRVATRLTLRPYQQEAVDAWKQAGGHGILSMATGTGKTLVALEAIRPKLEEGKIALVIVPTQLLVHQWAEKIQQVYDHPKILLCYGSKTFYLKKLASFLRHIQQGETKIVIATMASACKTSFKLCVLENASYANLVLVVDEVHRIGARTFRDALQIEPPLRLGLSATPERHWDEPGSRLISEFFGGTVYEYELNDAIRDGYLCPYKYHLDLAQLTPREIMRYLDLSKRISRELSSLIRSFPSLAKTDPSETIPFLYRNLTPNNPRILRLTALLVTRSRVLKKAQGKNEIIKKIIEERNPSRSLVYCEDFDQLDQLRKELTVMGLVVAEYTSRLDEETRKVTLDAFGRGDIRLLLSCKCLDEGVDIPDAESAILMANTQSTREFIQRRGRLLRPAEGKKEASIYDILTLPCEGIEEVSNLTKIEKRILIAELRRIKLFAKSSTNIDEAQTIIQRLESVLGDVGG
jgi:superfamily II DNA or RNA helicase